MRIKLRSAMAAVLGVVTALAIAVAGSPAAVELVAGASASSAHAAKKTSHKKKAAHKKKAHKKKAHKKRTHKTKKCKAGQVKKNGKCVKKTEKPKEPSTENLAELEKGGTKAIESASEIPAAPAFTRAELLAYPKGNWISSQGGGVTGDHFSQLDEITPANVASMKADWMTQLDGSAVATKYSGEADMTVYKGVGYYPTGADDIFAVSIASGKILWVHKGELPETVADVCCGWDNRGVAIGDGMVYSAVLTGSVEALNQKTGELVWKTELGEPAEGFTATSQPLYYEGMVFIGPVGSEYGVRGFMEAFNAKTGALVWKHYNIPAPGEFGHETWPVSPEGAARAGTCKECDNEWEHGGATTWNAPTVSAKTGDIYYSTANAGGLGVNGGDSGGATRGGANLWTVSMLALNYKTGELVWGYQEVHHDIWDYDASTQPIMIATEIEGKKVEGIVQANKDGWPYFVNSETGTPVFGAEEKAVPQDVPLEATYPTQPIPTMPQFLPPASAEEVSLMQKSLETSPTAKTFYTNKGLPLPTVVHGGYEHLDVFAPFNEVGSSTLEISSGGGSGAQASNEAYDPETHMYYVCAHVSYSAGDKESQTQLPQGETYGTGKTGVSASATGAIGPQGYLTAYNMETGKIVWQDHFTNTCYYGPTVTKGGVLFYALGGGTPSASRPAQTVEGQIQAFNAATGEKLPWSWEIGGYSSPISVFEYNGEERVAVYGGGHQTATPIGDDLWDFSLKGTDTEHYASGATPPPPQTLGPGGE